MSIITGLRIAVFLFVSAAAGKTQTLDGVWQTTQIMQDGNHTRTVYVFRPSGDRLTGTVEVPWGNLPIEEGVIHQQQFSFQIHMGSSLWKYEGQLTTQGMELTLHDPNAPAAHLIAVRLPRDPGTAVPAIPAPALHIVPSNGLAATPPMGWNSWNHFQGHIDDATVRQIADAMVSSGMRDAGYVYVNIDDTWEGERAADGTLRPNKKFPDMKALADYVHAKGLKLGIYSSPGPETCAGYPGSYGYEEQDARTFAAWGIDYLKYDWCSAFRLYPDAQMRAVYQKMGAALQAAGRPIVYSLSSGGKQKVWTWGRLAGANLWRTTDDISDSWRRVSEIGFSQSEYAPWAGPGHWNDPDMLEIGNGGLTFDESKTHMTLWAMLAAPLITGNDLRTMTAETASILLNREVIAIDQDRLGKQGRLVLRLGDIEVWQRPLANGDQAVAIFNRSEHAQDTRISWHAAGFAKPPVLRDLWKHASVANPSDEFQVSIPAHGALLFRAYAEK